MKRASDCRSIKGADGQIRKERFDQMERTRWGKKGGRESGNGKGVSGD